MDAELFELLGYAWQFFARFFPRYSVSGVFRFYGCFVVFVGKERSRILGSLLTRQHEPTMIIYVGTEMGFAVFALGRTTDDFRIVFMLFFWIFCRALWNFSWEKCKMMFVLFGLLENFEYLRSARLAPCFVCVLMFILGAIMKLHKLMI